jgi:hypothetical protein
MSLFALVPRTPVMATQLDGRVREKYEGASLRLDLGVWVVSDSGTTKDVSDKLEITEGSSPLSVVVFELTSAYSGRAPTNVWEQLKKLVERGSND